jgi:putative peptidoglycan lipid II flippase
MKVVRSAAIISLGTFVSRILGLAREILAAAFMGAGWVMDAFAIAFQVPNLFRRLFGEGALSAAFIPVFSDSLATKDRKASTRFANAAITMLVGILGIVTLVGIGMSFALPLFAGPSGESQQWMNLFAKLLRIMLPYLPLICVVALVGAILNAFKHFLVPALASTVLNLCWIGGFLVAWYCASDPVQAVTIVAWAIVLGGVLELVMQAPVLMAKGVRYRPVVDFRDKDIRSVLKLMWPTAFGIAVVQVNILLDSVIAKVCVQDEGAVSVLYFGNRLMQFPLALIGVSFATAVFPYLAEYAAQGRMQDFRAELKNSFGVCLFISLPAGVGLAVLAGPIVKLFFQWERFTAQASERTVAVLVCYSLGVWAYCCLHVVNRAFYALKDTATPVKVGASMVLANVTLNLALVWPLREAGLALATAVTAVANLAILLVLLSRKVSGLALAGVLPDALKMLCASLLMGGFCLLWNRHVAAGLQTYFASSLWQRLMGVLVPVALGAALYLVFASLLRVSEMSTVIQRIRARFGRRS